MSQAKTTRFVAFGLVLLALCALSLVACSAATQTKQGGPGEFCTGPDNDCRPGLLCQDSVCTLPDTVVSLACTKSCDKIGTCGIDTLNCLNECATTVRGWSDSVIEDFSECIAEDLSCDEMGNSAEDAAQACYDRLETDADRLDRCRDFKAKLQDCDPNASTANFERACIRMARTVDTDTWNTNISRSCLDSASCQEQTQCINGIFGLN